MIIIPVENPVIEGMNSYYLDIEKLIEHYQGEISTGGMHFKSPSAEGVVFFDESNVLSGVFEDKKNGTVGGKNAIGRLIDACTNNNFSVSIYAIESEGVYFWANLLNAESLYKDLSSEFTDLDGLIKKMCSEKLTGYIDVSLHVQGNVIPEETNGGLIYFSFGDIIGCTYSWKKGELIRDSNCWEVLVRKSRENGASFNVKKVTWEKNEPIGEVTPPPSPHPAASEKPAGQALPLVEELLNILEDIVKGNRKIKIDFETSLRKKFVAKADLYDFLDPFVDEFNYAGGKAAFIGQASGEDLLNGVLDCAFELAKDLQVDSQFSIKLLPWKQKFADEIWAFNIEI